MKLVLKGLIARALLERGKRWQRDVDPELAAAAAATRERLKERKAQRKREARARARARQGGSP